MSGDGGLKPAYLIMGADEAKIGAALRRLRARAESEGGEGSLESFDPADGQGPPDTEALVAALPAMSLMASRRYLVADHLERAGAKQVKELAAALGSLPPDVTVVLVHRDGGERAVKGFSDLRASVKRAGGEVLAYDAPRANQLPAYLVQRAKARGLDLDADAARLLVERMGPETMRLENELERLAIWAGEGGSVTLADLEAMVADTSEEVSWALSDSVVAQDAAGALRAAERLAAQGEAVTGLIYQASKRLRAAHAAVLAMESGTSTKEVERSLGMHPYAARMLIKQVQGGSPGDFRRGICTMADLEWWTRGGSEYPEEVALTIALRRAAGAREAG
jgi:DNA polymerase III subunit delta